MDMRLENKFVNKTTNKKGQTMMYHQPKSLLETKLTRLIRKIINEDLSRTYKNGITAALKTEFKYAPQKALRGTSVEREIKSTLEWFDRLSPDLQQRMYKIHTKLADLQERSQNVDLSKYDKTDTLVIKERKRRYISLLKQLEEIK
jgi:hypothetical protein